MSRCRSCAAVIVWADTEHGRHIPLDAEPVGADEPVTFVLRDGVAIAVPAGVFPDEPHFVTHFSTCPNADAHRRRNGDDERSGDELRDEGIERAYRAALEEWKVEARRAIDDVAHMRDHFTTDAVWTLLDRRGVEPPREPRAIAGVLRGAVRDGVISPTSELRQSVIPRGHRRRVLVYLSCVHGVDS
jgi:hypothetical protein